MTVFKKHEPITVEEGKAILGRPCCTRLWLSVQGPIYHVYAYDLEEARILLEAAREAGFKHSGILVPSEHPLVELRTGIRADILLADGNTVIVEGDEKLQHTVSVVNEVLMQAKKRNERLLQALRKRRPARLWEPAVDEAKRRGWI